MHLKKHWIRQLWRTLRRYRYRMIGIDTGPGTTIDRGVCIREGNIRFGADCYVNRNCYFDLTGDILIGDNVVIGHGVTFITAAHQIGPPSRRAGDVRGASITVENGVWIGSNATILPGVVISSGSIVAAGAVVNKRVHPNTLVAGVPAKVVRPISSSGECPLLGVK